MTVVAAPWLTLAAGSTSPRRGPRRPRWCQCVEATGVRWPIIEQCFGAREIAQSAAGRFCISFALVLRIGGCRDLVRPSRSSAPRSAGRAGRCWSVWTAERSCAWGAPQGLTVVGQRPHDIKWRWSCQSADCADDQHATWRMSTAPWRRGLTARSISPVAVLGDGQLSWPDST